MARQHRFRLLILTPLMLAALLLSGTTTLQAETPAPPPPGEEAHDAPPFLHPRGRGHRRPMPPPDQEPDLTRLSPEERQRYEENRKRWDALSPQEKEIVRKHHEERRERMHKSISRAIEESGLTLDEAQRKEFARRYMSERRKLEHELRQEMNQKRRERSEALVKRLAEEFRTKEAAPKESASEK